MEHLVKLLELLKDRKNIFILIKILFSLPFAIMLYKCFGGKFYFDDFSKKRIAIFIENGEFLIPLVMYVFAYIFTNKLLPFALNVFIYPIAYWMCTPVIKKMCFISRDIPKRKNRMLSELKTTKGSFNKTIINKSKSFLRFFYFKKIEINTPINEIKEICMQTNVLLLCYCILYYYFLYSRFIFVGMANLFFLISPVFFLIYMIYNKCFIDYLCKYPNIFGTIFVYKMNEKNELT